MIFLNEKQKKSLRDTAFRFSYVAGNWKQIFHLAFGTKHFGVNNTLCSPGPSIFARKGLGKFLGLFERIAMIRARAFMGFIPLEDAVRLFPKYAVKNGYVGKGEKR